MSVKSIQTRAMTSKLLNTQRRPSTENGNDEGHSPDHNDSLIDDHSEQSDNSSGNLSHTPEREQDDDFRFPKNAARQQRTRDHAYTPTSNRFTPIQTDDGDQTEPQRTRTQAKRPPPIIVRDIGMVRLNNVLHNLLDKLNISINNNKYKITCDNHDTHEKLKQTLVEQNVQFFSHLEKNEKPRKLVIKYLPSQESDEDIKDGLLEHGIKAISVNRLTNRHRQKTNIIIVTLTQDEYPKLVKLNRYFYINITVEPLRYDGRPYQCHRCLRFGHSSDKCFNKLACTYCAGNHNRQDCELLNEKDANKCVNCGKGHSSLYRGCQSYKDAKERKRLLFNNRSHNYQLNHNQPNSNLTDINTNYNPRQNRNDHSEPNREHFKVTNPWRLQLKQTHSQNHTTGETIQQTIQQTKIYTNSRQGYIHNAEPTPNTSNTYTQSTHPQPDKTPPQTKQNSQNELTDTNNKFTKEDILSLFNQLINKANLEEIGKLLTEMLIKLNNGQ